MTQVNVPIYDGKESLTKFLRKVEAYNIYMKQEKYQKILNFLNEWMKPYNLNMSSLTEFKNISAERILSDNKHNKRILKKYSKKLIDELNLVIDCPNDETDTDEIGENEIIVFVRCILKSIDYSINSKLNGNELFYTIRN
jgi:hypothetical protein